MNLKPLLIGIAALGAHTASLAYSINLAGTRAILQEQRGEATLQLNNHGTSATKVQLFVERALPPPGNPPQASEHSPALPMQAYPSLMRIQPNASQRVHIVLQPNDLPPDRESLFWLNILEEPQHVKTDSGVVHVLLQSRIKLFYRPSRLQGAAAQAHLQLSMQLATRDNGLMLEMSNPSAYHITLKQLRIMDAASGAPWAEAEAWQTTMLSPHGEASIALKTIGNQASRTPMAEFTVINDFGGLTHARLRLAPVH